MVQWLRLHTSSASGVGSVPSGDPTCHEMWSKRKIVAANNYLMLVDSVIINKTQICLKIYLIKSSFSFPCTVSFKRYSRYYREGLWGVSTLRKGPYSWGTTDLTSRRAALSLCTSGGLEPTKSDNVFCTADMGRKKIAIEIKEHDLRYQEGRGWDEVEWKDVPLLREKLIRKHIIRAFFFPLVVFTKSF